MRIHGVGFRNIGEVPGGADGGGIEAVGGDRGWSSGELDEGVVCGRGRAERGGGDQSAERGSGIDDGARGKHGIGRAHGEVTGGGIGM